MSITAFITAFIACFFGTLAGGGAGLILQPIFILIGLPYVNALASSKLAVGFIGIGSSIVYFRSNILDWKVFWWSSLYGLPFVILGTYYSAALPTEFMKTILGFFIIFMVGINFFLKKGLTEHQPKKLTLKLIILACLIMIPIGFYSGWISAGSGIFLTLMYIHLFGYDQKHAIAMTLSACGLFWNGVGAIGHILLGHIVWDLAPSLILGAFLGSFLGAKFSLKQGNLFLKNLFQIVALATGMILILK